MFKKHLGFPAAVLLLLCAASVTWAQSTLKGRIVDSGGSGIPGVTVLIKEKSSGATSDAQGNYAIRLANGTYTVMFSSVGYDAFTKKVTVAGSDVTLDVTLGSSETSLGEVVVSVGGRSTQRTATDTPLPVDILSANDLASTGQQSFDKALQYRVPSFNTVTTPVNDATSLLDPYEIRNMGPSRTLILINGKRKNSSSLVYTQTSPGRGESGADISAIPTDAIERVEILRDGASAQYGSDAIAGVVNIILKDNTDGGVATLNTGITHEGDGQSIGFSLNNGAKVGANGFINYSAALNYTALANRPGTVDAAGEASDFGANLSTVQAFLAKYPDAGNINGAPENASAKFLLNGGSKLSAEKEFYYNAAYVYKKVNSFANYRTPYWRTTDEGLLHAPGTTYEGYLPTFEGDLTDYNATVGFKSKMTNGWNSDASYTIGGNKQLYTVANSWNRSLGKASPILFHPGGFNFSHNVGNIDLTKALNDKISLAVGSEFRYEAYSIIAGDTASYVGTGADSFPGFRAENSGTFTRWNFGGYADLGVDVTPKFFLNGTARLERYSDFGNAFVWKVSTRYKLNDMATFRASASTGFRAPSLHQINLQSSEQSFVPGQGIQTKGLVNNRSAQAKLLGVPSLKPETSLNFTAGFGFTPSKDLSLTLDYFNIKVDDRIIISTDIGPGGTPASAQLDQLLQTNGIVRVRFFLNGINTTTQGLDVVASKRNIEAGAGKLNINLAGNYLIENKLRGNVATPKLIADAGQSVVDEIQTALLLSSRPKYKAILGFDYQLSKISLNMNNTLFGPTTFRQDGLGTHLKTVFDPKVVTDLGAAIPVGSGTTLNLTIANVFNVLPKWNLVALDAAGEAILADPAQVKAKINAITFNGRYSVVTYDGSHFSQLGLQAFAQLVVKL